MVSENPPSHTDKLSGEYQAALVQLDRYLFGAVGDVNLSPEEFAELREAIRAPESAVGVRAREYYLQLANALGEPMPAVTSAVPPVSSGT